MMSTLCSIQLNINFLSNTESPDCLDLKCINAYNSLLMQFQQVATLTIRYGDKPFNIPMWEYLQMMNA